MVSERNVVTLSGGVTIDMSLVGDVSKIALIGNSALGFSVEAAGDLTRSQSISFGPSEISFSMDIGGTVDKVTLIPSGSVSKTFEPIGSLTRTGLLSGSTGVTHSLSGGPVAVRLMGSSAVTVEHSVSGVLSAIQYLEGAVTVDVTPTGSLSLFRPNYIGYAGVTVSCEVEGSLQMTVMMSGSTGVTIDATGAMAAQRYLSGDLLNTFDIAGLLSNNAGVQDLRGFLMTRRKTNREMVR